MSMARPLSFLLALVSVLGFPHLLQAQVHAEQHTMQADVSPSAIVEEVRAATAAFRDVRNIPEGYAPALGCVSGPLEGAMGVHFINSQLLTDATLDATKPEALIYEFDRGVARLVGVEYIVLASVWHATHAENDPPVLEGQLLLNFEESPNRFGLPAFYELHVWAWRDNPLGAFVDWNPRVSCEGQ